MTAAPPLQSPQIVKPETTRTLALGALLLLLLLTYGNHFNNTFHFDDTHNITDNPYVQSIGNIPLFFRDAVTSGTLPPNRTYRPVVTTSLAIDYWLAEGYNPFWFHASTFLWYLLQIYLMYLLFRRMVPEWVAFFAAAIYAVHPAMAETVNYIIQRADLYSTLGVIAGLVVYIEYPKLRNTGLYLLPVVLGILSKAPAAVFPALLFLWIWLFDSPKPVGQISDLPMTSGARHSFIGALIRSIPAFLVSGIASLIVTVMTPSTYVAGATSPFFYRITQPAILMGYFRKFFLPLDLSADTDRLPVKSLTDPQVILGALFVITLLLVIVACCRVRASALPPGFRRARNLTSSPYLRPIAFGLAWFLIASLPTSLIALSEVENDHRMFFPFVGLTLAISAAAAQILKRLPPKILAPIAALTLITFAWGAHQRNKVWATDESLWYDVTVKSPNNGRGLMNYGLSQMGKGRTDIALSYFLRALAFNPNYYVLEINLGVAFSTLGNAAEGERHFLRAIELAPQDAWPRYYYARWLSGAGRRPEAIAHLETAVRVNPDYLQSRYLLMQVYADMGDRANLTRQAQETLARFPGDAAATSWLARASTITPPASGPVPAGGLTAENYLALSLSFYRAGKYPECISAAQSALKLKPDYAEAWNNIGAAYNQLAQWDQGIAAEQQAVRLKPDLEIARNNLAFAVSEKQKLAAGGRR